MGQRNSVVAERGSPRQHDAPGRPRGHRPALAFVAAVLLCSAAVGCQSQGSSGSAVGPAAPTTTVAVAGATAIDACSMVSAQDITALLGAVVRGTSTNNDPEVGNCTWTNPATQESVSVEINIPDTARNNTLPPPESGFPDPTTPGPDGMRFLGGGEVEFAAGNRTNTVQVAVLHMSTDQANSAAVDLARKIAPKVPR